MSKTTKQELSANEKALIKATKKWNDAGGNATQEELVRFFFFSGAEHGAQNMAEKMIERLKK